MGAYKIKKYKQYNRAIWINISLAPTFSLARKWLAPLPPPLKSICNRN